MKDAAVVSDTQTLTYNMYHSWVKRLGESLGFLEPESCLRHAARHGKVLATLLGNSSSFLGKTAAFLCNSSFLASISFAVVS